MVDYFFLEKIIWYSGTVISIILGLLKLKNYVENPKIFIGPDLGPCEKLVNKYGQDEIRIKYRCKLINTGKDLAGELRLNYNFSDYTLSELVTLKKNDPKIIEGEIRVSPAGINVKKIGFPMDVNLYFRDIKGKRYSIHNISLNMNGLFFVRTPRTI